MEKIDNMEMRVSAMKEADILEDFTRSEVNRVNDNLTKYIDKKINATNKRLGVILDKHLSKEELIGEGPNCVFETIIDYIYHNQSEMESSQEITKKKVDSANKLFYEMNHKINMLQNSTIPEKIGSMSDRIVAIRKDSEETRKKFEGL